MDHRVKTSRELANHLAYAASLLRGCRESLPRIDIDDSDAPLIDVRIEQALRDLDAIRKRFTNYMAIWQELKVANEASHNLNAGSDDGPPPAT